MTICMEEIPPFPLLSALLRQFRPILVLGSRLVPFCASQCVPAAAAFQRHPSGPVSRNDGVHADSYLHRLQISYMRSGDNNNNSSSNEEIKKSAYTLRDLRPHPLFY